jgi:hypothetical protein
MPASSNAFKAVEDAKVMQIDTEDPTKIVQIGRRARRLPPTQQGHICLASDRNVRQTPGDHRAHPQHQARLKDC